MLVRSAGRRQQRQTSQLLAASFAQLALPWLAPAQLRWSASQAALAADSPSRPRRDSQSKSRQAKVHARHLATAADQYATSHAAPFPPPGYSIGYRNNADKNVPWDFARKSQASQDAQPSFSTLRPYEDPIILNTTLQNPEQLIKVQHGVHGTTMELLQHLHTSLRVGRFNRAEAIIQRLAEASPPTSPEVLHAHTAYLAEHLRMLASHGKDSEQAQETMKAMQRWFEVEVRNKGVQPDARILVIMIRAAIRSLDGKQRDRSIRRYADGAESIGAETHEEVLYSEDYDDNEFTILGRATSELYEEEEGTGTMDDTAPPQPSVEAAPNYTPRWDTLELADLPEVLATQQKGGGLSRVKQAMRPYINLPRLPADAPIEAQRERAFERQRLVEETSVDIAVDKWREADEDLRKLGINTAMQTRPISALMWQWYQSLLPTLQKELAEVKKVLGDSVKRPDDDRYHYGPLLESIAIEKFAANTILWVMSRMARGKDWGSQSYEFEMKLNNLTVGLAKQLEAECSAEASKVKLKGKHLRSKDFTRTRKALLKNARQKGSRPLSNEDRARILGTDLVSEITWPLAQKTKLAAMLIQKLIESAHLPVTREHPRTKEKVTQMQPAFLHRAKYVLGKKLGVVMPNPALTEKLESEPLGSLIAKRMPMIVEPKPWTGWNSGGYLHYPNPILRLGNGDKSGKDYFLAADSQGDMGQVYAGLTALSKVPWKVHPDVFKVQLEAWNSGEPIGNFAPMNPQFDIPPEPEASSDPSPRRQWLLKLREIENKRAGLHSKRCFQNFQTEIARAVVNETLYFPHSMDFRGRAYPIPPYLNHMGADNVRGLLVFAEGKELGETGLRWLKIHLATAAGFDKASLDERVQYTDNHLDDIYDSVRNPLGGRKWWLQAEDAWQTLAACFEITAALDSPDPTKFLSTIPVQQDGTCNGLQHYAALGGDMVGAKQVNLEPGDRPVDVYTAVAEAVKDEVRKDSEQGNPVAQKLHGHITRKCVKQPVMTNVYGVTFYGAKEQVHKQLEILFPNVSDIGDSDNITLSMMSHYVATKIFKSLGSMFTGAQAIQHWLGQCADRIATCLTPEQIRQLTSAKSESETQGKSKPGPKSRKKKMNAEEADGVVSSHGSGYSDRVALDSAKPLFKSTVVWTTPLRLPVVQPYRKSKSAEVKTNLQSLHLQEPQVWDPVSKRKQLQAFPPNFIHSLDATHMLLSALRCNELGMTFASIHDSFWTHACDVDQLSIVLRDAFVEMHSEDIIGRLREEFLMRYKGCMYLATVVATSPVGERITKHRQLVKDTTTGRSGELAVEAERMRLLNSEDAEEKKKGEAMVTPGSIWASEGDDSAFVAPVEMNGQALGDMPESELEATNTDADDISDPAAAAQSPEGIVGGSVLDMDTEALADTGSAMGEPEGDVEISSSAKAKLFKTKRKTKRYARKIYVWLPMTFPEVPAKGDFDVRRLRASKYFFH
ncbi:hypothetical protein LTR36_004358 [Oleoguttula mirabilis]|uniref:DNA-directed RNA polymerase n=1 Tax=Oleoguttula mirabilis TaxID=1507867 RepID=A0AAV9JGZ4_9PEZI|nr:hypothetical protein LTR36_004358 [Oleoguttula mirabilis]